MTRIERVMELSDYLHNLSSMEIEELAQEAMNYNGWFTLDSVSTSLAGISYMLADNKLSTWLSPYPADQVDPKRIALILAGNIPLVGFHDILSAYISGHDVIVKPSHQDTVLIQHMINFLNKGFPRPPISISERLTDFDAVIATGSTNSSRYFDYYFSKYPHIIRKSRTSIGVLSGNESAEELELLGEDIFSYFGFGCRNVSMLMIPQGYDITKLDTHWGRFAKIADHHKYANNYDYQKSILLINRDEHLDFGYLLLRELNKIHSPISQLNYMYYDSQDDVDHFIEEQRENLQCVVGKEVPFGKGQRPELWDYADGVDTMKFLTAL